MAPVMLLLLAVAVEGCCGYRVHRGDQGRGETELYRRSLSAGYLKFS